MTTDDCILPSASDTVQSGPVRSKRIIEITRPSEDEEEWTIRINTRAGRSFKIMDRSLRRAIKLYRQARRAKCWDLPLRSAEA